MSRFECERCGAGLKLSIADAAYVCARDPQNHAFPRLELERRWMDEARSRAEADPSDVDASLGVAAVHGAVGALSFAAGEVERAQAWFKDELGIIEALHVAHPANEGVTSALLEALGVHVELAERTGQRATCLPLLQRMLPLAEALHEARPDDDDRARALCSCLNELGRACRQAGDVANAARHFTRDLELVSALHARLPDDAGLVTELAIAHFNQYLVTESGGDERAHLEQAIRVVDELEASGRLTDEADEVRDRAKMVLGALPAPAAKPIRPAETPAMQREWLVARVEEELRRRYP